MSGTMAGIIGIGAIACGAFADVCLTASDETILIVGGSAFILLGFTLIHLGSSWHSNMCRPTNMRPR